MNSGRAGAARAVAAVLSGHALDRALVDLRLAVDARPFAQALAYATVRHLGSGRALLTRLLSDPERPRPVLLDALILTGLADLRWLQRAPHAAVAETVAESRRLGLARQSGLINALLRRYLRQSSSLHASVEQDETAALEHPRWWIDAVREAWPEQADALLRADDERAPLWLRSNRRSGERSALLQRYAEEAGLVCQPHPVLADAFRVDPARPVELLPGFEAGALSVQDAAAQRVVECLAPAAGMRVLDACAAPGGKTAHLLERCPTLAAVVALDIDDERLDRVRQTLRRLGLLDDPTGPQIELRAADARRPDSWWDGRPFDRILIDAPCSGSGVARRHPDIKWLRRPTDLAGLARTQGELLDALWPLLAPTGRLVYATCSIFPQENEAVLSAFLARQPQARCEFLDAMPLPRLDHGAQRLTGVDDEDGFYYAVLQHGRD